MNDPENDVLEHEDAHEEDTLSLEKSRPYSICTPPENGAHYMQDNFYFNAQGALVQHPDLFGDKEAKRLKGMMARRKADRAAAAAYAEALKNDGIDDAEIASIVEQAKKGDAEIVRSDDEIDIRGWAMGKKKYVFGQVRAAMQKKYAVALGDKNTILNWLVDEGHLRDDEIGIRG